MAVTPQSPLLSTQSAKRRRDFLRSIVAGACVLGAAILGLLPPLRRWIKRVRPPGALRHEDFLSACIKCGQCVQVCPVEAIKLADIGDGAGQGTPYIEPRLQACDFSCDALQCILACPTGALQLEPQEKEHVQMGKAHLVRPEGCLARQAKGFKGLARGDQFQGKLRYAELDRWNPQQVSAFQYDVERCDLCVRQCPIKGAIRMRPLSDDPADRYAEPFIDTSCTGCGVCEMICPAEPGCIKVVSMQVQEVGLV